MVAVAAVALAVGLLIAALASADSSVGERSRADINAEAIPPLPPAETQWDDAVVLGDSYTEGAGSSTAERDKRWTTLVAKAMKWDEHNLAVPGTGYVAGGEESRSFVHIVDEVKRLAPDVVLVSGGRNDAWFDAEVVYVSATELFDRLTRELPQVEIVVISPWWDDDPAPSKFDAATAAIERAAAEYSVRYIETGQPLQAREDLLSRDGIHPNDEGHAALADAVIGELKRD